MPLISRVEAHLLLQLPPPPTRLAHQLLRPQPKLMRLPLCLKRPPLLALNF
jgi:hypothetical protein